MFLFSNQQVKEGARTTEGDYVDDLIDRADVEHVSVMSGSRNPGVVCWCPLVIQNLPPPIHLETVCAYLSILLEQSRRD